MRNYFLKITFITLLFAPLLTFSDEIFTNQRCTYIYPENAENIILVLISVHQTIFINNSCSDLDPSTITDILQLYYGMDQYNELLKLLEPTIDGSFGN